VHNYDRNIYALHNYVILYVLMKGGACWNSAINTSNLLIVWKGVCYAKVGL